MGNYEAAIERADGTTSKMLLIPLDEDDADFRMHLIEIARHEGAEIEDDAVVVELVTIECGRVVEVWLYAIADRRSCVYLDHSCGGELTTPADSGQTEAAVARHVEASFGIPASTLTRRYEESRRIMLEGPWWTLCEGARVESSRSVQAAGEES